MQDRRCQRRGIFRLMSAVMGLMMYNLGVKCMWELVVECAMSWSQCSLLSTGHSAREFLWAEWDSITLPTHLSSKKTSHLHTQAKKKKKMLKWDGLFECTQDLIGYVSRITHNSLQQTKRGSQIFCLFHKIWLLRHSSLRSSSLISTPPGSVLCVLLGKNIMQYLWGWSYEVIVGTQDGCFPDM